MLDTKVPVHTQGPDCTSRAHTAATSPGAHSLGVPVLQWYL